MNLLLLERWFRKSHLHSSPFYCIPPYDYDNIKENKTVLEWEQFSKQLSYRN